MGGWNALGFLHRNRSLSAERRPAAGHEDEANRVEGAKYVPEKDG